MNIVTPYPTNIPINTVNVTTESARRDNQLREMITKPAATEAGVAERAVANEHDKSKTPQQNQNAFEANLRAADQHQKIGERGHQGEKDQGKQDQDKEREEAKKRLNEVKREIVQSEQKEVAQLKSRDAEVRAHEQAHASTGGQYAGSPTYSFKRGPDGQNYAVGGEVKIDTSPVAGDPTATIAKMRQVRAAALAPAEPSGQDRKVANLATQATTKAQAEQAEQNSEELKAKQKEQAETREAEEAKATNGTGDEADKTAATESADPFNLFATEFEETPINATENDSESQSVGSIFGDSGLPGGENRDQININRAAAEERNSEVVARAGRIQNFYAAATKPREAGFSQFA
jgi:hypothetical protein